jgi:hypothetical protein
MYESRVVEGISQKRENIGVMTQHYKCIDGGADVEIELGLARYPNMMWMCSAHTKD